MRLRTLAAFVATFLLSLPLAAQEQRGSIEGIVKDASGAILPGVAVTVQGQSGVKLDTISDSQGAYRFPSLLPGLYTVSAELPSSVMKSAPCWPLMNWLIDPE